MSKYYSTLLVILIAAGSCINNSGSDSSMMAKGRFIKIINTDDGLCKILLKLKNDSLVGFKTDMRIDDPKIQFFKNAGMEIEVVYKEYKNSTTNTNEKVIQSIYPVYNLNK
jgi:hypothetical protein